MAEFIDFIMKTLEHFFSSLGYFGIGLGMLIESCCIPLPSEIILPISGKLVASGVFDMLWANVAVAVGSIIGSLGAYFIGYYGGRPLVIKLISKYGKYVFITMHHFDKADKAFVKRGSITVFVGRLLPIIRTFISLPAGIAKMNIWKFIGFSLLGMIPWNFLLIYLGFKFGESYDTIVQPILKEFNIAFIVLFALIILFLVYKFVRYYKRMKNTKETSIQE